jgi:hypothetical protein
MTRNRSAALRHSVLVVLLCSGFACSAVRPLLFWRDAMIRGTAQLVDEGGSPLAVPAPADITVNFIHRGGRIENSIVSVETEPSGDYRSPALEPGEYTVEAMLPGFAIESETVEVRNHEHRRVHFTLRKIRERAGRTLREAQQENIPTPGEVQIRPPPF